jgi:hypothetical protein
MLCHSIIPLASAARSVRRNEAANCRAKITNVSLARSSQYRGFARLGAWINHGNSVLYKTGGGQLFISLQLGGS